MAFDSRPHGPETFSGAVPPGRETDPPDPHDIALEQGLLGALLMDNKLFHRISDRVTTETFFDPVHIVIFEAMRREVEAGRKFDPMTLAPLLAHVPDINDGVTAKVYLGRLIEVGAMPHSLQAYAESLHRLAARRALLNTARDLEAQARHPAADIMEAAMLAVRDLDTALSQHRRQATRMTFSAAASDLLDTIRLNDRSKIIATGFADIDRLTGGFRRGQLVLVAGRPSMGKSTFGVALFNELGLKKTPGMFFSLEMTRDEVVARMLSAMSWEPKDNKRFPYTDALAARLSDAGYDAYSTATALYEKMPVYIDDQGGLTVAEIIARTRKANDDSLREYGEPLAFIIVDHLGKIKPSGRYAGNVVAEIGEISNALKQLAKDMNICVIALNQLNRGTEGRDNKRPTLPDLRNSGDLEQDADIVLFTYREAYYLERTKHDDPGTEADRIAQLNVVRNVMELIFAKNRSGPTEIVNTYCDIGCNVVTDMDRRQGESQ